MPNVAAAYRKPGEGQKKKMGLWFHLSGAAGGASLIRQLWTIDKV